MNSSPPNQAVPPLPAHAAAVVLAAGSARRFGGGKLLALAGGRPLITWAVDAALRAGFERVLVVLGHRSDELKEVLPEDPRLETIFNPDHQEGMGTSLALAAKWAQKRKVPVLTVLLGDLPLVSPHTVAAVTRAALSSPSGAAAASLGQRRGHPVAFVDDHFPALMDLSGDMGGRQLLQSLGSGLVLVPASQASGVDVDRPQDLDQVEELLSSRPSVPSKEQR